jgi:hypothetical protein
MKVVLTILGNHQGAGICNFPTREAAKDFALQLANTVNTYGLMELILMMNTGIWK